MKIKAIRPDMEAIRKALYEGYEAEAEHAGKRFAAIIEGLLQQTTRHWNESGENKYQKPQPRSTVKVNRGQAKVTADVHIVMIGEKNEPSFLWHILDQGRKEYTFPAGKRSPPIRERKRRRTFADTLKVDPFPGFTGNRFVIHGGTRVRAVPPNNWYNEAIKQAQEIAGRDKTLRNWKITNVKITGI